MSRGWDGELPGNVVTLEIVFCGDLNSVEEGGFVD
jgi:hypothetical protein